MWATASPRIIAVVTLGMALTALLAAWILAPQTVEATTTAAPVVALEVVAAPAPTPAPVTKPAPKKHSDPAPVYTPAPEVTYSAPSKPATKKAPEYIYAGGQDPSYVYAQP